MMWWVRRGDQTFGPVDEAALVDALRQGRIQPGDLACREGAQEWLLVSSVPGVAEVFAPKRSQPPLGGGQNPFREAAWMIGNMDGEIIEGPISLEGVKTLMARGTLTGGELIARVGSSVWQQIPDVMAEYVRFQSTAPGPMHVEPPAPKARPTIPPVPMPTGHPSQQSQHSQQGMRDDASVPSSSPGRPGTTTQPPAMHATQTAPIALDHVGPPRPRPFATTQTGPRGQPPGPPPRPASVAPPAHAPAGMPPPVRAQVAGTDGWYWSRGGIPVGPITHEQLRVAIIAGEVHANTPICRVDEWVWKPFSEFPELTRRSAPPPLPPRGRTR